MKRKQFSEEQIIGILKAAEAGAVVTDLCHRQGISNATYYAWKANYAGMEVSDAKRLRALEDENAKLKRLLADTTPNYSLTYVGAQLEVKPTGRTLNDFLSIFGDIADTAAARSDENVSCSPSQTSDDLRGKGTTSLESCMAR